jgi:2-succinyl-5-enolpyruvyl-6-hydroxy-3-cyclohexene-1-carboxylate synthase
MIYPKIPFSAKHYSNLFSQRNYHHNNFQDRECPLTIGFTNNPAFECYSIADERCAFLVWVLPNKLKKPVVLICSSGSALLNYYPALAEAFYSQRFR